MKRTLLLLWMGLCLLVLSACDIGAFAGESETGEPSAPKTSAAETKEAELTIQFSFGERTGLYSGGMDGGLPDGYGTFESHNAEGTGWVYEGSWEMGHMQGEGTTTFETGYKETGWYENDNLNGQGSLYQDDCMVFEGEFADNTPHGQGTLYSMCGEVIFSGNFELGYIDETEQARSTRLADFKDSCEPQEYEALLDSALSGGSLRVRLSGVVSYVFDPGVVAYDRSFMLELPDGNVVCVSYRLSTEETLPAPGKKVTVWGIADYTYTYEDTYAGTEESLPTVEAWDVTDISGTEL